MTREQKFMAHLIFRNKISESDGSAFEALFTRIMTCANPSFQQVKPQGRIGDKKNDGFDSLSGTYYQVYAPENLEIKEQNAINKLNEDFNGLYAYWKSICPIRKFIYVVNDKYKGVFPSLHKELANIHGDYPEVETRLFLAKDLEDICFQLSDEDIDSCLGFIPEAYSTNIDYEVLKDVVEHLLSIKVNLSSEFIPINPDFDKKIAFNGLSDETACYLKSHRINEHSVNDFFSYNSSYTKEELRNIFTALYQEALNEIPDVPDKADRVFMYILQHSYENPNLAVYNAILTLMAYYFEYCDIFQAPIE